MKSNLDNLNKIVRCHPQFVLENTNALGKTALAVKGSNELAVASERVHLVVIDSCKIDFKSAGNHPTPKVHTCNVDASCAVDSEATDRCQTKFIDIINSHGRSEAAYISAVGLEHADMARMVGAEHLAVGVKRDARASTFELRSAHLT